MGPFALKQYNGRESAQDASSIVTSSWLLGHGALRFVKKRARRQFAEWEKKKTGNAFNICNNPYLSIKGRKARSRVLC